MSCGCGHRGRRGPGGRLGLARSFASLQAPAKASPQPAMESAQPWSLALSAQASATGAQAETVPRACCCVSRTRLRLAWCRARPGAVRSCPCPGPPGSHGAK